MNAQEDCFKLGINPEEGMKDMKPTDKDGWRDLPSLQDVAAAVAAGDEIHREAEYWWEEWNGTYWNNNWKFRARPRKPATKKIVLRRALMLRYDGEYDVILTSYQMQTVKDFVMWLPGEEIVEIEEN